MSRSRLIGVLLVAIVFAAPGYGLASSQENAAAQGGSSFCPSPEPGVTQVNQLRHKASDGTTVVRTVRLAYLAAAPDPVSAHILEAGRVCIETEVTIPDPRFDCAPSATCDFVDYPFNYTIFVEQGSLVVTIESGTTAMKYTESPPAGYVGTAIAFNTPMTVAVGEAIVIENVSARFENPSDTTPAIIFATGFASNEGGPGCTANCWIPS